MNAVGTDEAWILHVFVFERLWGSAGGDMFTPLSANMTVCVSTRVERDILFIVSLFTVSFRVCHLWLLLFELLSLLSTLTIRKWLFSSQRLRKWAPIRAKPPGVCAGVWCFMSVCVIWHTLFYHTHTHNTQYKTWFIDSESLKLLEMQLSLLTLLTVEWSFPWTRQQDVLLNLILTSLSV